MTHTGGLSHASPWCTFLDNGAFRDMRLSTGATLLPATTLPDLALVIEEPHSFSATEESTGRQVS